MRSWRQRGSPIYNKTILGANADPTNTKCRARLSRSSCHPPSPDQHCHHCVIGDDDCNRDGDGNDDDDDMAPCPTPFLVLKVHPNFSFSTPLLVHPPIVRMILLTEDEDHMHGKDEEEMMMIVVWWRSFEWACPFFWNLLDQDTSWSILFKGNRSEPLYGYF